MVIVVWKGKRTKALMLDPWLNQGSMLALCAWQEGWSRSIVVLGVAVFSIQQLSSDLVSS